MVLPFPVLAALITYVATKHLHLWGEAMKVLGETNHLVQTEVWRSSGDGFASRPASLSRDISLSCR